MVDGLFAQARVRGGVTSDANPDAVYTLLQYKNTPEGLASRDLDMAVLKRHGVPLTDLGSASQDGYVSAFTLEEAGFARAKTLKLGPFDRFIETAALSEEERAEYTQGALTGIETGRFRASLGKRDVTWAYDAHGHAKDATTGTGTPVIDVSLTSPMAAASFLAALESRMKSTDVAPLAIKRDDGRGVTLTLLQKHVDLLASRRESAADFATRYLMPQAADSVTVKL